MKNCKDFTEKELSELNDKKVDSDVKLEFVINGIKLTNKSISKHLAYASELHQSRTKSLVEKVTPYVEQMQQVHIKLQQIIAKEVLEYKLVSETEELENIKRSGKN